MDKKETSLVEKLSKGTSKQKRFAKELISKSKKKKSKSK